MTVVSRSEMLKSSLMGMGMGSGIIRGRQNESGSLENLR